MVTPNFDDNELIPLAIERDGNVYFVRHHGDIAAGFPSPAEDFIQDRISLDAHYLAKVESTFINRIAGDSMFPDYEIGDLIIVRSDLEPRHEDDIVVAINGSAYTLKRYDLKNNQLRSVNPIYKNILQLSENDTVLILGVVTSLIREKRSG